MLEKLTLESLAKLDGGRVRAALDQAIARCESDCKDRPALPAKRKIALVLTIAPVLDPDGELDSCDVAFHITESVPKRTSKNYNMKATRGGLMFNELSPKDVHQRTIDEAPGPRGEANAG